MTMNALGGTRDYSVSEPPETTLSDHELLRQVFFLAQQERGSTVELVRHLAEIDARRLHVREGYGSLFAYCTGALRLGEHAAYNRIEAARLSRRFPFVLDRLRDGSLNLSTLRLLAPHLRPENVDAVVAHARGRSKREVEVLVASLAPRPDAASSVRRLPAREALGWPLAVDTVDAAPLPTIPSELGPADSAEPSPGLSPGVPSELSPESPFGLSRVPQPPARRPVVAPLSPGRYRVQFTVDEATHAMLRQAQELLRREIPDGDPGAVFERALRLLLVDVARRKIAATPSPRRPRRASGGSRHIPAHVKRSVWLSDEGRCGFVAASGRRCRERAFLEFHHDEPYAIGGEATAVNITLRCRAHNVYEAELAFGAAWGARCGPSERLAPGRVEPRGGPADRSP